MQDARQTMTQTATLLPLPALSANDKASWTSFRAEDPSLASPYFALSYLQTLEKVHPGIEVLKVCEGERTVGFLPFRRDLIGTCRPPDGPLADLHGVIASPDSAIDLSTALETAGLGGYAFSAVPYQQARHGLSGMTGEGNQIIDLSAGYDGWLAERYEANSAFRRTHRKILKLFDDHEIEITHDRFDPRVFNRLIELKQDGYASAGHFDVFSLGWPQALLDALCHEETGEVRGVMSVMKINGEVAAACLCMRSASVLHYWYPGYEKAFADLKPGHAMLFSLAEWAAGEGISEFHLGLGNVQYKRQMASYAAPVRQGVLAVATPQKILTRFNAWSQAREASGGRLFALPAKLARKVDRVALMGRLSA
ncbi:MAG: GNAT family N-acetyltransferase [Henriciella sp.]|uniref:GNAT family N-acetyltransferase n=1 Tax=Henriciella sp. TaxID=1968823 RepID=UPI0032EFAAD9